MEQKYSLLDFGVSKREGTLKNGLKTVFIRKKFAPIYASVVIRAGSIFDPPALPGLAHFTEHILAAGSKDCFKESFWGIMESVGGYRNATTAHSWMSVQCEVAEPEHMPKLEEHFRHALGSIHCTDKTINDEVGIIASEICRRNSKLENLERDFVNNLLSNGTSWLGNGIGTVNSIRSIRPSDVEKFFTEHCCVENMVLIVVGGCTWKDVEKTFSDLPLLHGSQKQLPEEPEWVTSGEYWLEQDTPETRLRVLFPMPNVRSREFELLSFALKFVHDGLTSRFYKKIRNDYNLAYALNSLQWIFWDKSYAGTYVGVPQEETRVVYEIVTECYHDLIKEGISQQEIDAKIATWWFSERRNTQRSIDLLERFKVNALYPYPDPGYGPYPDRFNYCRTFTAEEMKEALDKFLPIDQPIVIFSGRK